MFGWLERFAVSQGTALLARALATLPGVKAVARVYAVGATVEQCAAAYLLLALPKYHPAASALNLLVTEYRDEPLRTLLPQAEILAGLTVRGAVDELLRQVAAL